MNKRAYLVTSVLPRDSMVGAEDFLAKLEQRHTIGRFVSIRESDLIYDYVEGKNMHPLCRKEWLNPIKNAIIVSLLHKTDRFASDTNINGVIISGQFILDPEIKAAYTEILQEQGYSVSVIPIYNTWFKIMVNGYETGEDLNHLFKLWKMFCEQYGRIYSPDLDQPKAIVVDSYVVSNPEVPEYETVVEIIKGYKDKGYKIICLDGLAFAPSDIDIDATYVYCNGQEKLEIFWTRLVYHYNVRVILEGNILDAFLWKQIGVPCLSLVARF